MSVFAGPNGVESGLVGYWDAGNTRSYPGSGTTWYDISGRNNTLTLSATGQSYSSSKGGTINFTGTGTASIASATDFAFGTGDCTVESWFQNTSTASAYSTVFYLGSSNFGPQLRFGDAGFGDKLQCGINMTSSSGCFSVPITKTSSQNIWYHVVLTRTSSVNTFWINGIQQNLGSGANPSTYPSTSFTDGSSWVTPALTMGNSLVGNISQTKIYSRGLSSNEIIQNFNAIRGRYGV